MKEVLLLIHAWSNRPAALFSINSLRNLKERQKPRDKVNKNGDRKKFLKNLDSDWTIKNDKANFGLNENHRKAKKVE